MFDINKKVADLLRELGDLTALNGESQFKLRSYVKAADLIAKLDRPLTDISNIGAYPGIGTSIHSKIQEIVRRGSCEKLDVLRRKHGDLLTLLAVPGVGPATARSLKAQGVTTVEALKALVEKGKITDSRIVAGLKCPVGRTPLAPARAIANQIVARLQSHYGEGLIVEVAGSIRRKKADVGDIDIVICGEDKARAQTAMRRSPDIVSEEGDTKVAGIALGMSCQIRLALPGQFGAMLLYSTGSKDTNILMRQVALTRGLTLNEYGLWCPTEGCLASKTEQDIFAVLDLPYQEPWER